MKKNHKNETQLKSSGPPEMDWSHFSPLEVKVQGNFEKAFKLFRNKVQLDKVLSIYKEKQSYEKPSEKKRRKHNEAIKRTLELKMKQKKIMSGEYEKEKVKRQAKKDKRKRERDNKSGSELV